MPCICFKIVRNTWGCRAICCETCHEFENINIFSSNLTYLLQSIHCFSNKALATPLSTRFGLAINKDKEIKDLFWKITFGSVLNSFFAAFLHLNWTLTRFSEVYCQHSWKPWILATIDSWFNKIPSMHFTANRSPLKMFSFISTFFWFVF